MFNNLLTNFIETQSSKPGIKIENVIRLIHTYLSTGKTLKARDPRTGQEATIKSTPNSAPTIQLIIDGIPTEQVLNGRHSHFEIDPETLNIPSRPEAETTHKPTEDQATRLLAANLQSAVLGIASETRIRGLLAQNAENLPDLMEIVDKIAQAMTEPRRIMTANHIGQGRLVLEFNLHHKERHTSEIPINAGLKKLCLKAGKRNTNTLHDLYPSEHARQITEILINKLIEAKPSKELRAFRGDIFKIRETIFKVNFHCYLTNTKDPKFVCDISIDTHQL